MENARALGGQNGEHVPRLERLHDSRVDDDLR